MTFDDCKLNMAVAHITQGDGVVAGITDLVKVVYERKNKRGEPIVGLYDRRWFEVNPGYLFGRSEP